MDLFPARIILFMDMETSPTPFLALSRHETTGKFIWAIVLSIKGNLCGEESLFYNGKMVDPFPPNPKYLYKKYKLS